MKYKYYLLIPVLSIGLICGACSDAASSGTLRASLEQSYGGSLNVKVFLEGQDGYALNAAKVVLTAPDASSSLLSYNADACCYKASLSSPPSGTYSLKAESLGLSEDKALSIPFIALSAKPVIQDLTDATGKSAAQGESLAAASTILVDATSVSGASKYRLSVYASASLAYSASGSQAAFTIPASALSAGSYAACVEAQAINGDPLLESADYYAVSASDSASFVFKVE